MLTLVLSAVLLAEPSAPPLVPIDPDVPPAPPLLQANNTPRVVKQKHQRRKAVLIAAGAAVFGLSYGTSAIVAGTAEGMRRFPGQVTQLWPLFIPFAGPVITMFTGQRDPGTVAFLAFDALTQVAAVVMLLAGLGMTDDQPIAPRVWLVPSLNANGVGANFGLRF